MPIVECRLAALLVPILALSATLGPAGAATAAAPDDSVARTETAAPAADPRLPELRAMPLTETIHRMTIKPDLVLLLDGRDRFLEDIAKLDPEMRRLVLIEILDQRWGSGGLHTFFYMDGASVAPEIRTALQEAGLDREYQLFSLAMALFGTVYPIDGKLRESWFGYGKPGQKLNLFDHALMAIATSFGTQQALLRTVEGYVRTRPELLAAVEKARGATSDEDRLNWLCQRLEERVDLQRSPAELAADLDALPKDYRTLAALCVFEAEFMDGGVHQFFFNSSGALAPQAVAALSDVGLWQQAAILGRGLTFFKEPYPVDTKSRRRDYFNKRAWETWDKDLSGLTDTIWAVRDAGVIIQTMEEFARRKGLLPD